MEPSHLQQKIKQTLEEHSFRIVNDILVDEKFIIVSNFGSDLDDASTFYIDKKINIDNLIIGANITLETRILTKSLINKIQLTSTKYNVSCSPIKYDIKNDTGTMALQIVYNFLTYDDENFMLYVNNFKDCIISLYLDIHKYLQHQESIYLDLSMFEGADWSIFDPYTYILERDKKFNGSWEMYITTLKNNLNQKEKLAELLYVEMCKRFEEKNDIPIDLACDYIIDNIMQYVSEENNKERLLN